jgi:hypothetical protein
MSAMEGNCGRSRLAGPLPPWVHSAERCEPPLDGFKAIPDSARTQNSGRDEPKGASASAHNRSATG